MGGGMIYKMMLRVGCPDQTETTEMGHSEVVFRQRPLAWANLGQVSKPEAPDLTGENTRACTRTYTQSLRCQEKEARIHLLLARCLSEEFLFLGRLPPLSSGLMLATEVLTQGKHLKTQWLPGGEKRGPGWNGSGVGA